MNLTWRQRRQLGYLAIPIVPVLLFGGYLLVKQLTTATCNDGRLNQGERGIDCEGPCPQICAARILPPQIEWSNAFPTLPGTYNLAAGIENLNSDIGAENASVNFKVYNDAEELIYENNVLLDLRPSSKSIAFDGPVQLPEAPAKVSVLLDISSDEWKTIQLTNLSPELQVMSKRVVGTQTEPRVEAVLNNVSNQLAEEVSAIALVLDEGGRPVAASATKVTIAKDETAEVVYTWPRAFPTTNSVCQQPVDVVLAIDASGSMNSISSDPPEPLTSVKQAAKRFIGLFSETDQMAVVSFANQAEVKQSLTQNLNNRIAGVNSVVITPEAEVGYTNLASALNTAVSLLQDGNNSRQAIILLTDGLPTAPDYAPDPELSAITAADTVASRGIELFAIGLGSSVNEGFLTKLVDQESSRVFKTSDVSELSTIYSQIASAVCVRSPYNVEIYPNSGL
jgi:Mg-chelatase subunit ChlD